MRRLGPGVAGAIGALVVLGTGMRCAAQVAGPAVSITGVIDTVTTAGTNLFDANFASRADSGWFSRNRGRFWLIHEIEPLRIKAVLGLELDLGWGQVSANESVVSNSGQTISSSAGGLGSPQSVGEQGRFDLGNDVGGVAEIKHLYVEFPLPWMLGPLGFTTVRLGGQPFDITFKPGALATTDFGGVWLKSEVTDMVSATLTYAQLEERVTGRTASGGVFNRGDDFFVLLSGNADVPVHEWGIKFRLRRFVGYMQAMGTTSALARCRIHCAGLPFAGLEAQTNPFTGVFTPAASSSYRPGSVEHRIYTGVDARIERGRDRWGYVYLDPTVIYMHSTADVFGDAATCSGPAGCPAVSPRNVNRVQSWLVDLRGGWFCDSRCLDETLVGRLVRVGDALHVEGLFVWTPGDASHHNLFRKNRIYHPIATDREYLTGWGEILALGTADNLTGNAHGMGDNVGLGRYGRVQVGARVTHDIWRYGDEALAVQLRWSSMWTDRKVDTDAGPSSAAMAAGTAALQGSYGNVPCALVEGTCLAGANRRGDARYVGTEVSFDVTYEFLRGLTLDLVGAHLFAGPALDSTFPDRTGQLIKRSARDADLVALRVRYRF